MWVVERRGRGEDGVSGGPSTRGFRGGSFTCEPSTSVSSYVVCRMYVPVDIPMLSPSDRSCRVKTLQPGRCDNIAVKKSVILHSDNIRVSIIGRAWARMCMYTHTTYTLHTLLY